MEFEGRITAVLPARTGTRQDGTTWTDLSFVFAYYENGDQRFEDSAIVSTFDTNLMAKIAPYIMRGQDGKAVVENDVVKMTVPHIACRCGFSLKVKNVKKKDGTGYLKIQESRCYRLEIIGAQQQQPAPQQRMQGMLGQYQAVREPLQQAMPFPPQVDAQGYPVNDGGQADDLPF
jgi:hypothetical protein